MMSSYEWCKFAFDQGWARKDQLIIWVRAKKITEDEFLDITGVTYVDYCKELEEERQAKLKAKSKPVEKQLKDK